MNLTQLQTNILSPKITSKLRKLRTLIDKTVQFKRQRWAFASLLSAVITYRAIQLQFLAILYIAFLYLIYLIVLYFTPSGLPDPDQLLHQYQQANDLIENNFTLKSTQNDRPILRAITQFNLWKKICLICFCTWICTFFQICKIPVYWPFLLIYFVWLVGLAVQRHLGHMKVYKYSLKDFDRKTGLEEDNNDRNGFDFQQYES